MPVAKKVRLDFDEAWQATDVLKALNAEKIGDSWIVEADVSDLLSIVAPIRAYGVEGIEVTFDEEGLFAIHLPPPENPHRQTCPTCHGSGFV